MTDKTDIAALREAAIKATPGNWKLGVGSTYAYVQASIDMRLGGKSFVKLCHVGRAGWRNQQSTIDDARFIALANPVAILAILDQLEAERQRADEAENSELEQRLANAEHHLYMKDLAIHNLRAQRKAQFKKRKSVEAELRAQGVDELISLLDRLPLNDMSQFDVTSSVVEFAANLRAGRKV